MNISISKKIRFAVIFNLFCCKYHYAFTNKKGHFLITPDNQHIQIKLILIVMNIVRFQFGETVLRLNHINSFPNNSQQFL